MVCRDPSVCVHGSDQTVNLPPVLNVDVGQRLISGAQPAGPSRSPGSTAKAGGSWSEGPNLAAAGLWPWPKPRASCRARSSSAAAVSSRSTPARTDSTAATGPAPHAVEYTSAASTPRASVRPSVTGPRSLRRRDSPRRGGRDRVRVRRGRRLRARTSWLDS